MRDFAFYVVWLVFLLVKAEQTLSRPSSRLDESWNFKQCPTDDGLRSAHYPGQSGQLGSESLIGTPQDFATFIASEGKEWADVRKRSGVHLEWGVA
jgi:hypothetical protein